MMNAKTFYFTSSRNKPRLTVGPETAEKPKATAAPVKPPSTTVRPKTVPAARKPVNQAMELLTSYFRSETVAATIYAKNPTLQAAKAAVTRDFERREARRVQQADLNARLHSDDPMTKFAAAQEQKLQARKTTATVSR